MDVFQHFVRNGFFLKVGYVGVIFSVDDDQFVEW